MLSPDTTMSPGIMAQAQGHPDNLFLHKFPMR